MGKSKKKRQEDFQKVKLKVGRKLKKGDNITNASFKTRRVQISQKLKTGHTAEPSTRKKQNITELLSQCRHYNTSVRHEAVTGLRELVINFPEIVDQHLAAMLEKSSELLIDKDAATRHGAVRLLKIFLPKVTEKQISPFFPLLCAHLCCAMTHIYDDIQFDSLSVLDILLETFPHLMISKSNQVLTNFIDQISRKQNQGQDKGSRSLSVNPNSKTSSQKWRTFVLNRLEKFLVAILDSYQGSHESSATDNAAQEAAWSDNKVTSIEVYPKSFQHAWEAPSFTLGQSSDSGDQVLGKFQDFVTTLVPLMVECWIESGPSKQMSHGAGNLLHSDSVGIIVSILNVTQLLGECISRNQMNNQESFMEDKYMKDFQQHFLSGFPYSLHDSPGFKDRPERVDQVSAESINLTICDIMTQFLTNQQRPSVPVWLPEIVTYLKDLLQGKYKTKMLGQSSNVIVKILQRLVSLNVEEGCVSELLSSAFHRFKGAHNLSAEKKIYLKFYSELCLADQKSHLISEDIRTSFLSSLPDLLTAVAKDNQEMTTMLITTMKKAACQNCAGVLDLISRHMLIWFDDEQSIFLHMDKKQRHEMLSLLYFLPDMDPKLYESLFKLTREQDIDESELDYMLQIVHNRYLKHRQDQTQAVLYMGFLGSLLIGCQKRDRFVSIHTDSELLGYHAFEDAHFPLKDDKLRKWTRHVYIVERVCSIIGQCDNQEQVFTVIEKLVSKFLKLRNCMKIVYKLTGSRPKRQALVKAETESSEGSFSFVFETGKTVVNTRTAYGVCRFAELMSQANCDMDFCKQLCFSVIHESVLLEEERVVPVELVDMAVDLVLRIPDALLELLHAIINGLKKGWSKLEISYYKVCLVFLTEQRRPLVKQMKSCVSTLKDIVNFKKEVRITQTEGHHWDQQPDGSFSQLEYLVSTIGQ